MKKTVLKLENRSTILILKCKEENSIRFDLSDSSNNFVFYLHSYQ